MILTLDKKYFKTMKKDNDKEDLIQDFISVITSFCARIYGQRRSKRKTENLIKELEDESKENS